MKQASNAVKRPARLRKARKPPRGEPWVWLTRELLASDAWRALSVNARRFIEFLLIEDMNHAGTENGNLAAPYDQLEALGMHRNLIRPSIDEAIFFGLVRITVKGGLSYGSTKRMSRYRLTFLSDRDGTAPTNDWKGVNADKIAEWNAGRRRMRKAGVKPGKVVAGEPT